MFRPCSICHFLININQIYIVEVFEMKRAKLFEEPSGQYSQVSVLRFLYYGGFQQVTVSNHPISLSRRVQECVTFHLYAPDCAFTELILCTPSSPYFLSVLQILFPDAGSCTQNVLKQLRDWHGRRFAKLNFRLDCKSLLVFGQCNKELVPQKHHEIL